MLREEATATVSCHPAESTASERTMTAGLSAYTLYPGRRAALLSQHGKERVIAPEIEPALGCLAERVRGYDTDRLGRFTRSIPRPGTQLDAARKKADIGMELAGLPLGLASEGPSAPTRCLA